MSLFADGINTITKVLQNTICVCSSGCVYMCMFVGVWLTQRQAVVVDTFKYS